MATSALEEILGGWVDTSDHEDLDWIKLAPGLNELVAFAKVLNGSPREETLHRFFAQRPAALFSLGASRKDSDLALISKPRIGTKHVADFAVISVGQGGGAIHLIELERSAVPLFTKRGTPAAVLQSALGQIADWKQWTTQNLSTFVQDTLETVAALPVAPSSGECWRSSKTA